MYLDFHRPSQLRGLAGNGTGGSSPAVGRAASNVLALAGVAVSAYQTYHDRALRGAAYGAVLGAASPLAWTWGQPEAGYEFDGGTVRPMALAFIAMPFVAIGVPLLGVGIGYLARSVLGRRARRV